MGPRPRVGKNKAKKAKKQIEEISDDLENEEDLNLMNAGGMGELDQLDLTAEEKDEQIIKNLNSNNPQAAQNLLQFSFKDRGFKTADANDHLVFHIQVDGKILLKDSDDGRDQEDYWDNKERINKKLLANMNKDVIAAFNKDPLADDARAQQKSLRNQFNF